MRIKSLFKKKTIKYFVSYCGIENDAIKFGNADFIADKAITSTDQLRLIELQITEKLGLVKPIIINWQKFDA